MPPKSNFFYTKLSYPSSSHALQALNRILIKSVLLCGAMLNILKYMLSSDQLQDYSEFDSRGDVNGFFEIFDIRAAYVKTISNPCKLIPQKHLLHLSVDNEESFAHLGFQIGNTITRH